jgi:translation elongation factor EF-4
MLADSDYVTILQGMLVDAFPVYKGAIGAVKIFQERIAKNRQQLGVMATHGKIVDTDVIVILSPDSHDFFIESVLADFVCVETEL